MLNHDSDDFRMLSWLFGCYESYGRRTVTLERAKDARWSRGDFSYLASLGYVTLTTQDITLEDSGMLCYFRTYEDMIK